MRAGTVALLLATVVALVSVGIRATHGRRHAAQERPGPSAMVHRDADRAAVHLEILNGTGVNGLAGRIATSVGRVGCVAGDLSNAERSDLARSLLVNRALDAERALSLAGDLGGVPVVFEADAASSADAALILGADHARVLAALGLAPDRRPEPQR